VDRLRPSLLRIPDFNRNDRSGIQTSGMTVISGKFRASMPSGADPSNLWINRELHTLQERYKPWTNLLTALENYADPEKSQQYRNLEKAFYS